MIAVLGDTHLPRGARRLSDECVQVLEAADLILHVGDFTAVSVLDELRSLAPVAAVYGNVDEPGVREQLPERLVVEVEHLRIGLVHDAGGRTGRHERLRAWFPGCDLVCYGHSHLPELERHRRVWIVNPGSPTDRRRAPTRTMAVVREGEPALIDLGP